MKFVHIDSGASQGEDVITVEWRNCDKNVPVSLENRNAWVNELVEEMRLDNDGPFTRYISSGDSMVVVTKDDEGTIEVHDCKLRRAAMIMED